MPKKSNSLLKVSNLRSAAVFAFGLFLVTVVDSPSKAECSPKACQRAWEVCEDWNSIWGLDWGPLNYEEYLEGWLSLKCSPPCFAEHSSSGALKRQKPAKSEQELLQKLTPEEKQLYYQNKAKLEAMKLLPESQSIK